MWPPSCFFDRNFPRSVRHNVSRARNSLRSLTLLDGLLGWLETLTIEDVLERSIHDVLEFLVESVGEIGAAIHADFFAPSFAPTAAPREEQKQDGEHA